MADLFFKCPKCNGHLVVDDRGAGLQLPCPFCSESVQIPMKSSDNLNAETVQEVSTPTMPSSNPSQNSQPQAPDERRRLAAMMTPDGDTGTSDKAGSRKRLPSGRNQTLRTADDIRKAKAAETDPTSDLDSQFQELIRKEIVRLQGAEPNAEPARINPQEAKPDGRRKPLGPLAQHAEVVPTDTPVRPQPVAAEPERIKRQRPDTVGASLPPLVTLDSMELDSEVAKQWGDQAVVKTGRLNWLAVVAILGLLCAGAYFGYYGYQEWASGKQEDEAQPEKVLNPIIPKEEVPSAAPEVQPLVRTLEDFHQGVSAEAKSRFVRNRLEVLPLMEAYYSLNDVESRLIDKESLRFDKQLVGKTYYHTISGEYSETLRPFYADMEETPEGMYLLDWKSWVGYSPMSLEAFAEEGLTDSHVFRLWVEVQDYTAYRYADAAKYRSFRLKDKNETVSLYGYVELGTPDAENLLSYFRDLRREGKKQRARLMLAIRFEPESDKRRGQVLITRYVNDSWIDRTSE